MLDRREVEQRLTRLDWSKGFNRDGLLAALLAGNVALPNEFLSAIPPFDLFSSPSQVMAAVPDVVWAIHGERERRALGRIQVADAQKRPRQRQAS